MAKLYDRRISVIHFNLALILLCLTRNPLIAQVMVEIKDKDVKVYALRGGDEFNSKELDRNIWSTSYPWARHLYCSMDINYYSDGDDLIQENGVLSISARKSKIRARAIPYESDTFKLICNSKPIISNLMNFDYQSGLIYSQEKYTYGFFEIRFRTDIREGLWPAFWLFGADNQEIDIFEMGGSGYNTFHVDVHCKDGCNNYPVFMGLLKKNWGAHLKTTAFWEKAFHTIAIDWEEEGITWYLDGTPAAWWKGQFKAPLALIANLAVTNQEGSIGGAVRANTIFPVKFDIDYIRIWQEDLSGLYKMKSPLTTASTQDISKLPTLLSPAVITRKKKPEYKRKKLKTPVQRISICRVTPNTISLFQEGNSAEKTSIDVFSGNFKSPILSQEIKRGYTSLQLSEPVQGKFIFKIKSGETEAVVPLEML